ncbi:hypothetical protein [Alkalimonas amylolytica]|uniref:MSHA biogenesis protein MshJ n=1 Tax=Alkalimonas amylolytica TaxID=152573 RepID=A0A1H4FSN0_ALKAM|nr:hypothetical protein [Alkalimonas amylolytica]SEB00359.1 hypothetical protein SAMN04488051_1136 [Alkalimonas amylolytica]
MNWQQLKNKFQQLQLRERRLLFLASLGLLIWLMVIAMLEPAWLSLQQQKTQLASVNEQVRQTELGIAALQNELGRDINQQHRERIQRQEQRLSQLEQQLAERTTHFVGADKMLSMLQSLLLQDSRVRLMSLNSMTPQVVAYDEAQIPLLFEHSIQLVVQGNFQNLTELISSLEQLPWQLGWRSLHYRVIDHPAAELSIDLVTVGDHADFIQL